MQWIGVQIEGPIIKMVKVRKEKARLHFDWMRSCLVTELDPNASSFFSEPCSLVTGLEAQEVLVRDLSLKLTERSKILDSLPFQIEELIPYPPQDALVSVQIARQEDRKSSKVTLVATKTEYLSRHLDAFQTINLDPEQVSCTPIALWRYFLHFFPSMQCGFLLHFGPKHGVALGLCQRKLGFAHTFPIAMESFLEALEADRILQKSQKTQERPTGIDLLSIDPEEYPHLHAISHQSQKELARLFLFLQKKAAKEEITEVILSGNFAPFVRFREFVASALPENLTLCSSPALESYDATTLEAFAIPIGLALEGTSTDECAVQFRQARHTAKISYAKKRKQIFSYALAVSALISCFILGANIFFGKQEKALANTFHAYFAHKLNSSKTHSISEIETQLKSLESSLKKSKTPFPLLLSVPNVSETLSWLSSLPALNPIDKDPQIHRTIEIRNVKYSLVKYPKISDPSSPYQAKVELELETSSPELAKEFHLSLQKETSIADSKKEIAWKPKGNLYFVSFYLKNKKEL